MPAHVFENEDGTFGVRTPNGVHSKHTTKKKAEAQARLLNAIDHGFVPTHGKEHHKSMSHHKAYEGKTKGYK